MLTELELNNFRGFRSLKLTGLKRVNLVVGSNNSGKTSLLEALFLAADPRRIQELYALFRPQQGNRDFRYYRWLLRDGASDKGANLRAETDTGRLDLFFLRTPDQTKIAAAFQRAEQFFHCEHLVAWRSIVAGTKARDQRLRTTIVPVSYRDSGSLVTLVGKSNRKQSGEETMQRLLAKVDPRIRKVRIDPGEQQEGNQIILDVGLSELIPLSQIGQGVFRLLTILAEVIGDQPELILVDEIENGLHHSAMLDVWAGLAEVAESLGVQIFATTHSHECLVAAHTAFAARANYDLGVIQMFRTETGPQGRVLDRPLIEAALKGEIDLR